MANSDRLESRNRGGLAHGDARFWGKQNIVTESYPLKVNRHYLTDISAQPSANWPFCEGVRTTMGVLRLGSALDDFLDALELPIAKLDYVAAPIRRCLDQDRQCRVSLRVGVGSEVAIVVVRVDLEEAAWV